MKTPPPIYQQQEKVVVADRCKPLMDAAVQKQLTFHGLARAGYPGELLGKNDLPGLLSIGFWDAPTHQHWGLATHCNEGIELAYLETGKLIFRTGKKHRLQAEDMTITRPWQPHSLGDPHVSPSRLHWLILDVGVRKPHQRWYWPDWLILSATDLKKLTTLLRQNETPVWPAGQAVASGFQQIAAIIQDPQTPLRLSKLTILINELFLGLYEMLKTRRVTLKPELTSSVRTVELFLESLKGQLSLLQQQWTIRSMAQSCDLGVTHFTRVCKQLTNMTPMQYLNYQRIEVAAKILKTETEKSITEIAFLCGFNSSQYFATVFKRQQGHSPKKFR